MIRQLKHRAQQYWQQWAAQRKRAGNPQILTAQTLYIVPSAFGWAYAFVVLTLLSGAINYQISTIFLMTFLLAVWGLISAWEAHSNLNNLSIRVVVVNETVQGMPAELKLFIQAPHTLRFALQCTIDHHTKVCLEQVGEEGVSCVLPLPTQHRGRFKLPPIVISSVYPFGIYRVWSYAYFADEYYVYPRPINPGFWPTTTKQGAQLHAQASNDDMDHLRHVENPWSQANLIAWKLVAKEQGWYHKTRNAPHYAEWIFRLGDTGVVDRETQLSYLSYWLHDAEAKQYRYGLELDNQRSEVDQGPEHCKRLLRQLACYP